MSGVLNLFNLKLLFASCFIFTFFSCVNNHEQRSEIEKDYQIYCGSCHLVPDPASLSKDIWEASILPRMGIRLGIPNAKLDPLQRLSMAEQIELRKYNLDKYEKIIEDDEWERLKKYVIDLAPDSISFDETRLARNVESKQFVRRDFPIDDNLGANICAIEFDEEKKELWLADFNKTIHHWSKDEKLISRVASPVVDFNFSDNYVGWSEIGSLFPSNLKNGKVIFTNKINGKILIDSLRRPVQADLADLNGDGIDEIIVAEFGNDIGGLFLFESINDEYRRSTLLELPGVIKFKIKDMDNDGKMDIVALFAQGDESIFTFYQREDLQFDAKRILRFPPGFGTSDFELTDYNQDGRFDITTAHGDNADYSYSLKNFHGVRIFIAEEDSYKEQYFYPIYGSTKVIPFDFDQDGDLDIATSAFFPDFDNLIEESFVYLENISEGQQFEFKTQLIPSDMPVRSLCLEKADFDGDGDQDLILGQFTISPQPIPETLKQLWLSSKNDITVLFNQLK